MKLDKMPIGDAIALMLSEDAGVPKKLLAERGRIERVIRAVVRAFRHGGRLFYAGAGTSGRLGVLDASECPPTFRTPPDMVQGIIAGGQNALWQSVEGAEDDAEAGARAIVSRGVTRRDVVVGIAASGTTPFVWGALGQARRRGATTVLVCFNPFLQIAPRAAAGNRPLPRSRRRTADRLDAAEGGDGDEAALEHVHHPGHGRIGKVRSNLMTI